MKMKTAVIAAAVLSIVAAASAQNKPFPQHVAYAAGIKPNNVSQSSMDGTVSSYWSAYASRYIKSAGGSPTRYYIAYNLEGQGDSGASTVSEAHGYGMVLCAYMGDKTHFDGMYHYYKDHPSQNNSWLMAWQQDTSFNDINGADSATDGDMDIAYSLLIADKQWGSAGSINYLHEATNMINAIMQSDVNQSKWTLRLGDWATTGTSQGFSYSTSTRPSDFMFDHMRAYEAATGDTRWNNVITQTYAVINQIFNNNSPNTGLIPDFVVLNGSTYQPAPANFLESSTDGEYAYNSCRTPWRFATDYMVNGSSSILSEMRKMNSWIQSKSGSNPDHIYPGYSLSGTALDSSYTDDSFTSPFGVCAMIDSGNQSWLNTMWSWIAARGINTGDGYFGNSITMQCAIVLSGNWWMPTSSGGGGGSLPSGWTDADIGSVGVSGSGNYSSGTFTIAGAGADIWSTADGFNYAYQSTNGNITVIARVVSENNGGSGYAKAGVMIRETTAADSVEASVLLTPTNGVALEVRPTTTAATLNVSGWVRNISPPQWVKIVRSGSTFTGYYSADGSTWTQIASTNVSMASSTIVGLAVTSHNTAALNTVTFDNVSIAGAAPPADFSLSASPSSLTITQSDNGTSTITVNPVNGFNSSVSLTASGLPSGVTASFNPSSTTSSSTLTLTASSTATTGPATVTVTGTSGSLQHTTTISLTVNASSGGGSLPSGWTDADVGTVGTAGSASYSSGTFTVSGSGADIWNTADGFNYAYQSASGDTTVIARVVSENNGGSGYAKAGVMIRESISSDSIEASVLLTPTNGVAMEVRSTTGAATINVTGWTRNIVAPQWVKIVRSGNTFNGYYSADGSAWTQIASTNVTMASSTIAGLAVTSHDTTALNIASFDNVSVSGSSGNSIDTSAVYQIQNAASGLVLNNQGSLTNGSAITQWNSVNSSNLDWVFIPTSGGYYQINSVKSGKDAVVQGASTAQGAGIIQYDFGSTGNDQWEPVANGDGSYTFYNLNSGLVLEDPGSSTNKTTQMDQWGANGGNNQKWNLIKQ